MLKLIIAYSLRNKLVIILLVIGWIGFGLYSVTSVSMGVMPDVTTNQVQVITTSRNLSTQDIELFVTYPVEMEMANLPGVTEIRSISKFGLSVVTVVFDDDMGAYLPRQLVAEKLESASEFIPEEYGKPFMGPITTGLGEIYQYTLELKPGYKGRYSLMELRSMQDWIIKRQLSGIPGVVEVNTWGGKLKQYEIEVDPIALNQLNISLAEVYESVAASGKNAGAGYIEKGNESYFVRVEGMMLNLDEIESIVIGKKGNQPVLVKDVGKVHYGFANRFGAITGNGEGEKVMGQVMMLKGADSQSVIEKVKERVAEIEQDLPEGIYINAFLERSELIGKTTTTIIENLGLGALIVIFVLVLLMGDIRAGLIIASIIPLSLLFGISLMNAFDVDVNLMSLGAIDFGILVDGAVIIVEYIIFMFAMKSASLTKVPESEIREEKDKLVLESTNRMMRSAFFGQVIILIVFIPILSLSGIEGKMFRPMALSFGFILTGAMILCLTYVPVMASLFIKPGHEEEGISSKIIGFIRNRYQRPLQYAIKFPKRMVLAAVLIFSAAAILFSRLGGEFLPTLDEGDFVVQPIYKQGTSLSKTIEISGKVEQILLDNFPEVEQVVTRIGAAEIPTDPMSMEMTDVIIKLKPKKHWVSADSKDELAELFKEKLQQLPGIEYEFTQPIEMRFNELISGVRSDLAIKIFGHDLDTLYVKAMLAKSLVENRDGVADISVEKVAGLPQIKIDYDYQAMARYGLQTEPLNQLVQMAFSGAEAGTIFEEDQKYGIAVRLNEDFRKSIEDLKRLNVRIPEGDLVPLKELANISYEAGPAQISRDDGKRRIVVGINVRNRDVESLVEEIEPILRDNLALPEGYYLRFGGQFENMKSARARLMVAAPVALALIFILLFFTFKSLRETLLIFTSIPLATIGGVLALWVRGMTFSISAGIGFIALFGIAVLNGMVLISYFGDLKKSGVQDIYKRVLRGANARLRPVLMTATTATLGFLPMAVSTSAGAEVQKPLATVVIGGLMSATILTLLVLPALYLLVFQPKKSRKNEA